MMRRGELDILQEAIAKRLISLGDFAVADIKIESASISERQGSKACGINILVCVPMPLEASKYTAGPVFSKVALKILIERSDAIARHSPSLASIAETVTKALHAWSAPLECGYGKVSISPSSPWQKVESKTAGASGIIVNFLAQSVLE